MWTQTKPVFNTHNPTYHHHPHKPANIFTPLHTRSNLITGQSHQQTSQQPPPAKGPLSQAKSNSSRPIQRSQNDKNPMKSSTQQRKDSENGLNNRRKSWRNATPQTSYMYGSPGDTPQQRRYGGSIVPKASTIPSVVPRKVTQFHEQDDRDELGLEEGEAFGYNGDNYNSTVNTVLRNSLAGKRTERRHTDDDMDYRPELQEYNSSDDEVEFYTPSMNKHTTRMRTSKHDRTGGGRVLSMTNHNEKNGIQSRERDQKRRGEEEDLEEEVEEEEEEEQEEVEEEEEVEEVEPGYNRKEGVQLRYDLSSEDSSENLYSTDHDNFVRHSYNDDSSPSAEKTTFFQKLGLTKKTTPSTVSIDDDDVVTYGQASENEISEFDDYNNGEYTASDDGSDDQNNPIIIEKKVPIWRPLQRLILGSLRKGNSPSPFSQLLSKAVFGLYMMWWILRELLVLLWNSVIYNGLSLFSRTLRQFAKSTLTSIWQFGHMVQRRSRTVLSDFFHLSIKFISGLQQLTSYSWARISKIRISKLVPNNTLMVLFVLITLLPIIMMIRQIEITDITPSLPQPKEFRLDAITEWIAKFWPIHTVSPPPSIPPETLREFSERLIKLERDFYEQTLQQERQTTVEAKVSDLASDFQRLSSEFRVAIRQKDSRQDDILRSIKYTDSRLKEMQSKIEQLVEDFSEVGSDIDHMKEDLVSLKHHSDTGIDSQSLEKHIRTVIEQALPRHLLVKTSSSGQLEIDPVFWKHLQSLFKEDLNPQLESLRTKFKSDMASDKAEITREFSGQIADIQKYVSKHLSWDEFVRQNTAGLSSFIKSNVDSALKDGAVVSKREFMKILDAQILDTRKELLAKIRKGNGPEVPGGDAASFVNDLIDTALRKYSADILARPDYALHTGGANVIPKLTSKSYEMWPKTRLGRATAFLTGFGIVRGLSPSVALFPENALGQCWAFSGSSGQLGISLSKTVIVTDVTLEHVSKDVALDIGSAPQKVEIWGVDPIYIEDDLDQQPQYDKENFLIATVDYDVQADNPIQTFPVPMNNRDRAVRTVIVKVKNNWGNPAYTCLYRVRIHGIALE